MTENKVIIGRIKQLFAYTHRGDDNNMTDMGVHARVPLKFRNKLSSNELFVLSFIEIHQFMDKKAIIKSALRRPMPIKMFVAVLNISEKSIRTVLNSLKQKDFISEVITSDGKKKSYISNIRKKGVKYQILTLKFLLQPIFSKLTRDFLIKVLMIDNERIYNLGNIAELCRQVDISRNSLKKVLEELVGLGLLYEVEEGIFGINIKFMSETLDIANYQEMIDMKVEIFDKDVEIQKLRDEIVGLKKEILALRTSNDNMSSKFKRLNKNIVNL